ncbi:Chaperone required for the assembly of the mitochondrial F1-ATPase [hydrothermal vent metagenome]|uniref:Chaperone required for the assembly of the mitochondrial F1-ATPase n=1 Tax=hydrothermal vent metagenome TaxID=652676 RepID=A0A3B0SJ44_9ZZZZ
MSAEIAKRFWKTADVAELDNGFTVHLDGRPIKTPAKAPLKLPTRAIAKAITAEWAALTDKIDPARLPLTRSANAAIDKVTPQHAEVADMIAAYGDADLTCYRAEYPDGLIARQAEAWDPLLEWAGTHLNARLTPVTGVIHAPQNPQALQALSDQVHALDAFTLAAFHDLVSLSGSLIIGFAALHDLHPAQDLWRFSRVDELWQEQEWGKDDEASEMAAQKESAFLHAKFFANLVRQT